MQTIVQKYAPSALIGIWPTNLVYRQLNNLYNRELRNDGDLHVPFSRTAQISRFPLISLPTLWNTLPPELSIIRNKIEFKNKIKLYLMDQLPDETICSRLFCPACNIPNNNEN